MVLFEDAAVLAVRVRSCCCFDLVDDVSNKVAYDGHEADLGEDVDENRKENCRAED